MKTHIAVLAAVGLAVAANADTINATFNGISPMENVGVVLNSNALNVPAGGFNWTRDLGNPGTLAGFSPTFTSFCIDITQLVLTGNTYAFETYPIAAAPTSGLGAMGALRGTLMGRLFNDHYNSLAGDADPNAAYAGFQLAVWEIAFDGDLSLLTGNFTVSVASATALARANFYLSTITVSGGVWPVFALEDPFGSNTEVQGQVMIPAPGFGALLGIGGIAALRRRR